MSILASRGAELLEELHQKRIELQENIEKTVLQKLKFKMEKIKANQRKIQGPNYKEPQRHQVGKNFNINNFIISTVLMLKIYLIVSHQFCKDYVRNIV